MGEPHKTSAGIELAINPAWEVHPAEVKEWIDGSQDFLLLDCRRQNEWDYCRLPGAVLIPLHELQQRADELESQKQRRIVVYCHHGRRSLTATDILRKHGFVNVHSMAGGIEAWSLIVDPQVRRY